MKPAQEILELVGARFIRLEEVAPVVLRLFVRSGLLGSRCTHAELTVRQEAQLRMNVEKRPWAPLVFPEPWYGTGEAGLIGPQSSGEAAVDELCAGFTQNTKQTSHFRIHEGTMADMP